MPNLVGAIKTMLILACLACASCRTRGTRLESEIYTASRYGQVALLESLLKKGGFANWRDVAGNSPITAAAQGGKWDAVDMILRYRPAALQEVGAEGNSLLHFAASQDRTDWIERLVTQRASVEARNRAGSTALHLAAFSGHVKAVQSLLSRGAEKDALNAYRETPLHVATWQRYVAVVETLLAAGANPSLRAAKGESLLHYAALRCSPELIYLYSRLFRKLPQGLDPLDASGSTPLMVAQRAKEKTCERALLDAKARRKKI